MMEEEIENQEQEQIQEQEKVLKESAGQDFVNKIKPIGMTFFLFLFIVFIVGSFLTGVEPVKGYETPNSSEYYAQSEETLAELHTELEENLFPHIEGVAGSYISDGKVIVTVEEQEFIKVRAALLRYYEESLFEFVKE